MDDCIRIHTHPCPVTTVHLIAEWRNHPLFAKQRNSGEPWPTKPWTNEVDQALVEWIAWADGLYTVPGDTVAGELHGTPQGLEEGVVYTRQSCYFHRGTCPEVVRYIYPTVGEIYRNYRDRLAIRLTPRWLYEAIGQEWRY